MSGGVVCYLERDPGGVALRRVRLVAVGLSRSWDAPESVPPDPAAESASTAGTDGSATAAIRSAARWVAETVQGAGLRRVERVCVDTEGSLCAWLSAPSPDPAVIRATITQAEHDTGDTAGLGAGRLLAMASPGGGVAGGGTGIGTDTSVQALAATEPTQGTTGANGHAPRSRLRLAGRRPKETAGATRRHRYAVLAVPDAPVRVFLDELDDRGIEVRSVMTLWHALARAWDEPRGGDGAGNGEGGAPVVASEAGTTAIVLTEPGGRLVWAWSREGELITGGTIRLRALSRRESDTPAGTADALANADGTRRVPRDDAGAAAEVGLEFTGSEAGRIAVDWLAWSAQLGRCPRRVVCLAAPGATDETGQGPSGLGRHLARAWPGATIDAAVYDDPVGATLARLAGVRPDEQGESAPTATVPAGGPGAALVGLSSRPGRADRGLHRWVAGGLAAATVAIAALGWRLGSGAGAILEEEKRTRDQTKATLAGLESIDPNLSKYPSHKQVLETLEKKRNDLREQAGKVRAPRPVLEEAVRMLAALDGQPGVEITEFDFGALLSAKVALNIVESPDVKAGEVGPAILERLRASPGVLPWEGTIPSFGGPEQGKRRYILTAMWPSDNATTAGRAPGKRGGK